MRLFLILSGVLALVTSVASTSAGRAAAPDPAMFNASLERARDRLSRAETHGARDQFRGRAEASPAKGALPLGVTWGETACAHVDTCDGFPTCDGIGWTCDGGLTQTCYPSGLTCGVGTNTCDGFTPTCWAATCSTTTGYGAYDTCYCNPQTCDGTETCRLVATCWAECGGPDAPAMGSATSSSTPGTGTGAAPLALAALIVTAAGIRRRTA